MQGNQHSEKSCLCVKKEETKKTPTEPSLFAVSSSSYFNPGEVRENEEARLVRRFDARCYGGCAQTHSLQRVRPRRRLSRKCISLSLFWKEEDKIVFSRVDSFPEPRTFLCLSFCACLSSLFRTNGAREREREREREIHASSWSIARGGLRDFV